MSEEGTGALGRRIDTLNLPTRVANWAARKGIETIGALVRWHPSELRNQPNLGPASVVQLRELIARECGAEWETLWAEVRASDPVPVREIADVEWDALSSALPDAILGMDLASLGLPGRMNSYVRRKKLTTVEELVRVSRVELARVRGLGRGSIEGTRMLLLERAGDALIASDEVERDPEFPDWLLAMPLARVELPARMRSFVEREGLETVADLVAIPRSVLLQARNLGRTSLAATRERLAQMAAFPPRATDDYASFWALWIEKLSELEPLDRMVLTQRSGIHGEARTLVAIGEMLGVSRERVRQIETRAIATLARGGWVAATCTRLERALDGGALALDELEACDAWFGAIHEGRREAFAYFLERIAKAGLSIGSVDGRAVVAACSAQEVEASFARAAAALERLACPADRSAVSACIAEVTPLPGLAARIAEGLEERIHRDEHGRMVAFGTSRDAEVLAFLRQCSAPVRIHDVFAALGQRVRFPEEVFYFERGVVGLESHFCELAKWKRRLVPICVRIMARDPRQWRVPDLLEAVREDALLPEWFGHWNLVEILRRSPEDVHYLGRQRVALPGVNDTERVQFAKLARRILEEHGAPLPQDELERRMKRATTMSPMAFRLMLIQPPFVQVDEERVGLFGRDVPGGMKAIARFGDALAAELERAQRGLGSVALAAFVARLGGWYARWTGPMARGVARADSRFQLSRRSGGVGLAEWDDVRVPTRAEVARACVEEHGGRAPVSAVLARLSAHDGASLDRRQLGALAYSAGIRMRGDEMVLRELASSRVARAELAGLPEESRAIFEELLEQPLGPDLELLGALDAHVAMFARAESEGAPVDAAEAASLRERCRALLERSSHLGPAERRFAQAATRYFLLRDDADTDLNAGGLDDDDAVIAAVEHHLRQARALET